MPAPTGNRNASSHHLYSTNPTWKVQVAGEINPTALAAFARGLGDAGLWIAERLTAELDARTRQSLTTAVETYQMIGLYAAVAHECHQVAAELEGETRIKAAPLGKLDEQRADELLEKQMKALSLILSQCKSAWVRLQDKVQVEGERDGQEVKRAILDYDGKPDTVLKYLAGHMRSAKRMLRDLAANRAWSHAAKTEEGDATTRILEAIRQSKKDGQG